MDEKILPDDEEWFEIYDAPRDGTIIEIKIGDEKEPRGLYKWRIQSKHMPCYGWWAAEEKSPTHGITENGILPVYWRFPLPTPDKR